MQASNWVLTHSHFSIQYIMYGIYIRKVSTNKGSQFVVKNIICSGLNTIHQQNFNNVFDEKLTTEKHMTL